MTPTERFRTLFEVFEAAGYKLYLVGGSVRDFRMGVPSGTDFDFATDARPEQTEALLRSATFRTWNVGARFGTISTHCAGFPCEITTFRVGELYREGSRHPDVVFGARIEDDLARRDLSINAMAMASDGTIVDPFDGLGAIHRRELEVPGGGLENSISILRDDPLRLLRIARFAARLRFTPTAEATEAASRTASELIHISRERWKMELDKLLVAPHAAHGLRWLWGTGAWSVVFPAFAGAPVTFFDNLVGQIEALPLSLSLRWACVVRASAAAMAPDPLGLDVASSLRMLQVVASELRFSGDERDTIQRLLAAEVPGGSVIAALSPPQIRRLCVACGEAAEDAIWFRWVLAEPDAREATSGARDARIAEIVKLRASEDPVPQLPTGLGTAMMQRLSLQPGPSVKAQINRVREAILDGELGNSPSIEEALLWLEGREPSSN